MKKYLPFVLLGVGLLVLVVAFLVVRKSNNVEVVEEEEIVKEIPAEDRPLVTLVPSADGHYLKLTISQVGVADAVSMDYELIYNLADGRAQGVPGTVKLDGSDIVKDLLLGSESNGKFRYDEGIEGGSVTLRFRNAKGKLLGKLATDFTFTSPKKGVYEVTLDTFKEGSKTFSSK